MNILGAILAGGKSSRMGQDKGLMPYKGKPLVEYVLEFLIPVCDEIVISSNSLDYLDFGHQTIPDIVPDIGPMGGMFSVMNMIRADSYFFISCDSPYNSKGLAEDFIKERQHYDIIVPVHSNEKIEPLFGVYSYKVLSFLKKQIDVQDYKLMNLLKQCNTLYYDVPNKFFSDNPLLFKNINLPSDVN